MPGKRESGCAGTGSRWTVFWVSHWFTIALFLPCCCPASLGLFCRSLSLASCICVWFHTALMTLNPNCAAVWSLGEKVTGDPFTNPLLSFSLRCKFRIVDADKAKLDYCFLYFPKGHEDAGMLCTLPARLREKSPCEPNMPCLESLLCSSGLSFLQQSGMHLLCLQWETSIRWEEWLWLQCKRQQCGGSFSKGHQESHTLNTFP